MTEATGLPGNVLYITVDQWRGDCPASQGTRSQTPNLDRLAPKACCSAVISRRPPAAPAAPSLHTGQYLMNHRSVLNGTPLDARFTNIALEARSRGYDPVLFGYTDASPDPRVLAADDPRLLTYEGVLPGFRAVVDLNEQLEPWGAWLRTQGYDVPEDVAKMYEPISPALGAPVVYRAEHSEAAFLTGELLAYVDEQQGEPWFVHAAYIRPHPPYIAPEPYASMYDRDSVPAPVRRPTFEEEGEAHPLLAGVVRIPGLRGPDAEAELRQLRATYYGMMTEVDAQLGRLIDGLRDAAWTTRSVVLTSDTVSSSATTGSPRSSAGSIRATTFRSSCATHVPSPTTRAARRRPLHREHRRDADHPRMDRCRRAGAMRRRVVARRVAR
jgi:arylsulfatase A-like enzyme